MDMYIAVARPQGELVGLARGLLRDLAATFDLDAGVVQRGRRLVGGGGRRLLEDIGPEVDEGPGKVCDPHFVLSLIFEAS